MGQAGNGSAQKLVGFGNLSGLKEKNLLIPFWVKKASVTVKGQDLGIS